MLIKCFPLNTVKGFVDNDFNIVPWRISLDDVGDQRSGKIIVYYLVIRSQVHVDPFFSKHTVGNVNIC